MEFHHIIPPDGDADGEGERNDHDNSANPDLPIWAEVITIFSSLAFLSLDYKLDTPMLRLIYSWSLFMK